MNKATNPAKRGRKPSLYQQAWNECAKWRLRAEKAEDELDKLRQERDDARSDAKSHRMNSETWQANYEAVEAALRSRDEAVRELLKAVERLPATGACWELGCGCVSSTVRAAAGRLEKIVGSEGKR